LELVAHHGSLHGANKRLRERRLNLRRSNASPSALVQKLPMGWLRPGTCQHLRTLGSRLSQKRHITCFPAPCCIELRRGTPPAIQYSLPCGAFRAVMPCREDLARHIPGSLTQVANTPAHLPVVRASSHPSRPSLKHETAMKTANLHSRPGLFAIFLMAGGLIGWRTARTRHHAVSATPRPPCGTGGLSISPAHLRVAGMLLLFVVLPQLVWATPVLDAYALSAAGHANGPGFSCSTFGPDHRTDKFGASYQVGLPNAGCGVGEDSREATASTGSIMAASS